MEDKIKKQIFAINKAISESKVKNIHAAKNKINTLKIKLEGYQKTKSWQSFLSQ